MKTCFSHENLWFSCGKQRFSYEKLINQITQHKLFSFMVCRVEAMSQFLWKQPVFMKSSGFHEKQWFSCEKQWFSYEKLINQITEHKLFNFMVCRVEAMSQNSMKTATFHMKIIAFHTKDQQLPAMVSPVFLHLTSRKYSRNNKTRGWTFAMKMDSINQVCCYSNAISVWPSHRVVPVAFLQQV